jgi:hypothetical protein
MECRLWGMGYVASVSVKVSGFQDVGFRFQVSSLKFQVSGLSDKNFICQCTYYATLNIEYE